MLGGYSAGIEIHLIDHVTAAMANVNKALVMAQGNTTAFQKALEKTHTQMMRLQAMEFAGNQMFQGAAAGLNAMVEPAREYAHQLNIMKMNAMEFHDMQNQIKAAWDTSFTVPSTPTENLQALTDMRTIFGGKQENLEEARHLLPTFKKIETIMAASAHDPNHSPAEATNQIFAAVKAMEMRGKVRNPQEFEHGIEEMTRVMVATGGRVLPSDYQSMAKYARQMKLTLDDDFWFKVAPELILEMKSVGGGAGGAGGPGAMINAFGRTFVQGIMTKATAAKLDDLGLLAGGSMDTNTTNTIADGVVARDLAASNPERWVNEYLVPALLKAHPELEGDEMAINVAIADLRLQGLTGGLVGELHNKDAQFDKFADNLAKVGNIEQLYNQSLDSPFAAQQALSKSWETLMLSLGEVMVPFLPMINQFSAALRVMARVMKDNPWIPQLIVFGLMATAFVGGILAIVGAVGGLAIILPLLGIPAAAFGAVAEIVGLTIAGITLSLFALANLGPVFLQPFVNAWNAAAYGFKMMGDEIGKFFSTTWRLVLQGIAFFGDLIRPIVSAINPILGAAVDTSVVGAKKLLGEEDAKARLTPLKSATDQEKKANNVQMNVPKIVVNSSPGQSPEEIAEAVKDMIVRIIQDGILSGVGNTGLLFGQEVYP